ncbi:putative ACR, YggU family [uncultured archaeon]|nr:putative ACR, YggU family [uncultured archaeon]
MIINAKIRTNQPKFKVEKKSEVDWIISVTSNPKDNEANLELIKELKKLHFITRILRGSKSKEKTLKLESL